MEEETSDPHYKDYLAFLAMAPIESNQVIGLCYEKAKKGSISKGSPVTRTCPPCCIKGNVSFTSNEKIYHLPGGEFYDATTINPGYGERWFCSEEEALAAGWRKSFK